MKELDRRNMDQEEQENRTPSQNLQSIRWVTMPSVWNALENPHLMTLKPEIKNQLLVAGIIEDVGPHGAASLRDQTLLLLRNNIIALHNEIVKDTDEPSEVQPLLAHIRSLFPPRTTMIDVLELRKNIVNYLASYTNNLEGKEFSAENITQALNLKETQLFRVGTNLQYLTGSNFSMLYKNGESNNYSIRNSKLLRLYSQIFNISAGATRRS